MNPRVVLLPKRARPFYGRHPWVYAGAVGAVEGEPADGDVVDLVSHTGNFVARGLYNGRSKIRVRLYTWDAERPLDDAFFRERLASALRLRTALGMDAPGTACRLVFSEADGLSGVTLDRYDRWLVLQFTALGLARRREMLTDILVDLLKPEGIYLRTERGIGRLEGLELQDGLLWGRPPDGPVVIDENGIRFRVNLAEGQKTGFYLDQRDNREAVARLASGRAVLDAFCYTGGFGLHAASAGARSVLGVDQSEPALALARENAVLNGLDNVEFRRGDVFDELAALAVNGAQLRPGGARPAQVRPRPPGRGRGAARLPPAANAGRAAAGAGRLSGDVLLFRPHHDGYAGGVAGATGRRGKARHPDPRTPRAVAGPSRLGVVPGIALPEMPHRPGALNPVRKNVCL